MGWLFVRQLRPFVLLAGAASLVLNVALLVPALYMVQVFDRVFASRSLETLVMLSVLALVALALGYCMDSVRSRALAWTGAALERRLSSAALASVLHQTAATPGRVDTDALRDIRQLRGFLSGSGIHALFDAPWLPLYLVVIGIMHPLLGLTAAIGACLIASLTVLTERLTRRETETVLQRSRALHRQTETLARNSEVIVGMGMTAAAIAGWEAQQDRLHAAQARLSSRSARLAAAARMMRQALQLAMLAMGAWLVIGAGVSAGIMVAATILLGRALQPLEHLVSGWKAQLDARSAWQRLAARSCLADPENEVELPAPAGRLQLERVVFRAAAARPPLIKGAGFTLEAGESLGLIGPSAAGKTTLVRLILGIWKPQSGTVRLDGADIALCNRERLGKYLGYLPQDVELAAGTVAHNIARLGPVDSTRVVAAAQLAHAHEMIMRLPDGYDTEIGDAGAVLSGGQRQRIALARALVHRPSILLLDEATSELDTVTEQKIYTNLDAISSTTIVIAHRLSTIRNADLILVMDQGRIVETGTHDQLLARQGAYCALVQAQSAAAGPAIGPAPLWAARPSA
jgi:PrtD family type I secretion system ABC transporter